MVPKPKLHKTVNSSPALLFYFLYSLKVNVFFYFSSIFPINMHSYFFFPIEKK